MQRSVGATRVMLADQLRRRGDDPQTELEAGIATLERAGRQSRSRATLKAMAVGYANAGLILAMMGAETGARLDRALSLMEEAMAKAQEVVPDAGPSLSR